MDPKTEGQERLDSLRILADLVPNLEVQRAVREVGDLRVRLRQAMHRSQEVAGYVEILKGGEEFENLTNL